MINNKCLYHPDYEVNNLYKGCVKCLEEELSNEVKNANIRYEESKNYFKSNIVEHNIPEGSWECKNCGLSSFDHTLPTHCPGKSPNHFSFITEALYHRWIDYKNGRWFTTKSDEYLKLTLLDLVKDTLFYLNNPGETGKLCECKEDIVDEGFTLCSKCRGNTMCSCGRAKVPPELRGYNCAYCEQEILEWSKESFKENNWE